MALLGLKNIYTNKDTNGFFWCLRIGRPAHEKRKRRSFALPCDAGCNQSGDDGLALAGAVMRCRRPLRATSLRPGHFLWAELSSAAFEIFPTCENVAAEASPSVSTSEILPQGTASLRWHGGVNGAGPAWALLIASQIVRSTMTNLTMEAFLPVADSLYHDRCRLDIKGIHVEPSTTCARAMRKPKRECRFSSVKAKER